MHSPLIRAPLLLPLLIATLLAACGQRGPLYLPAPPPRAVDADGAGAAVAGTGPARSEAQRNREQAAAARRACEERIRERRGESRTGALAESSAPTTTFQGGGMQTDNFDMLDCQSATEGTVPVQPLPVIDPRMPFPGQPGLDPNLR